LGVGFFFFFFFFKHFKFHAKTNRSDKKQ